MIRERNPATPAPRQGLLAVGVLAAALLASAGGVLALAHQGPSQPPAASPARIDRAREAYLQHDLSGTERLLRDILQDSPEDRAARRLLGRVLCERGRLGEARLCYESLLKADPKDFEALRGQARVLRASGQPGAAVRPLQAATEIRKDDPVAWKELGAAQREAGDTMSAFTSVQKALSLDPGQEDLSLELGELLRSQPAVGAPSPTGSIPQFGTLTPHAPEDVFRNANRPRSPGVDPLAPAGFPTSPR